MKRTGAYILDNNYLLNNTLITSSWLHVCPLPWGQWNEEQLKCFFTQTNRQDWSWVSFSSFLLFSFWFQKDTKLFLLFMIFLQDWPIIPSWWTATSTTLCWDILIRLTSITRSKYEIRNYFELFEFANIRIVYDQRR